jgi:predicted secreted protein
MALNGADVLLLVDGVAIGSQRDVTFERSTNSIDSSHKNSGADQRVIPGRRSSTLTLDALYVPDDAAYLLLRNAWETNTMITVNRQEEGSILESAAAMITSLSERAPDMELATISISLTIDGAWVSGS